MAESILKDAIERVPSKHPQGWCLLAVLGNLYRQTGRQAEAEEAYAAGRVDVDELAASISDETLRKNFQQRAYARLSSASGEFSS